MNDFAALAKALQQELQGKFRTVRISAVQTADQFLKELKGIHPDHLPAAIVVFDNMIDSPDGIREDHFTVVAVDRFVAGSDDRALSILETGAKLLEIFPADGRELGGVFVHPVDCVTASPDGQLAALAVGLVFKQGF